MEKKETSISGLYVIEPQIFGDHRGYFFESYNEKAFHALGITTRFVQDNESFTQKKGTIRGIHFQNMPMAQTKIVRVIRGAVLDVAVDLRKESATYLKWVAVELSEENKRMLYLPQGFGHGFLTLTDDVLFQYKVDHFYSPEHDRSIHFDDPDIGVDWGIQEPILSDKDRKAPLLRESDCNFI